MPRRKKDEIVAAETVAAPAEAPAAPKATSESGDADFFDIINRRS